MANLADKFQNILISDKNKYSVEVSPGKDLDFDLLSELKPRFCSVTWRVKSENDYLENVENSTPLLLAEKLQQRGHDVILNIPGKHFCKDNVLTILNKARNIGVRGIFAIQGDLPYQKRSTENEIQYASDLVKFIKEKYGNDFCIGIAGYPEKYPHSSSREEDIDNIKYKVSLGANFIITQGCFSHKGYSEFVKICRSNNITVPIYCGIFLPNIFSIHKLNGITYPDEVINKIACISELNIEEKKLSQIKKLSRSLLEDNLIDGIHIFTINDVVLCKRLFHEIGII